MSNGSGVPLLYRQGSRFEDKEIDSIFPKAVFLRAATGRLCSVGMFNELPKGGPIAETSMQPEAPPRAEAAAATTSSGGISTHELDQNLKKGSDTSFAVQRGLVDKILENQAEIMRSARIVPHEQNGQVVGVKMYGIRRNSLLGQLGLQNGDLLRSINGYDMASPDSALEAYSRLRSASNLSVAITRRGKPMTVEYQIE
jgi:general secretion pathway protein C